MPIPGVVVPAADLVRCGVRAVMGHLRDQDASFHATWPIGGKSRSTPIAWVRFSRGRALSAGSASTSWPLARCLLRPASPILILGTRPRPHRLLRGTYSRCSDPNQTWELFAVEINLRQSGTTHPMMLAKLLTRGACRSSTMCGLHMGAAEN